MGPSGFILDFLVPGVVALAAGVVLAIELELRLDEELSNAAATIVVSAVLVGAYLVGIALRYSMRHLQYRELRIWHHRFMDRGPDEIESLKARWIHDSDDRRGRITAVDRRSRRTRWQAQRVLPQYQR